MMDIFLVEDDQRLAELTQRYLEQNGFSVHHCDRGDTALAQFQQNPCRLVILDLMLPGLDGLSVCRELRQQFAGPILMLTAKDTAIDQVVGLEAGADDYVYKPADPMVLLARVRTLLRRTQATATETQQDIQLGILRISPSSQQAWLADQPVELSTQEFALLHCFAKHPGQVLSRDELLRQTRGIGHDGLDRSIDVRISKLRKRLQDEQQSPKRIKTVWGKGYILAPDGFILK